MLRFLTVLVLLTLTQYSQAKCPEGCKHLTAIYDDIKCKPIFEKPDDCCPSKYDCSHITEKPKDKCLLQNKVYDLDEEVPSNLTYGDCQIGCKCSDNGQFICAVLDCPEYLGVRPPPHCFPKYELDKCCSVGHICPPFDDNAKCIVNGKTYYEGQQFSSPNDECLKCVCQKGFKGEFVEPFCRKRQCFTELRHSTDINNKCAVVYSEHNKCCPQSFICPDQNSSVVITSRVSGPTCTYGRNDLSLGEKFEKVEVVSSWEQTTTMCECAVPPLVSCVSKHSYDLDKAPPHIQELLG